MDMVRYANSMLEVLNPTGPRRDCDEMARKIDGDVIAERGRREDYDEDDDDDEDLEYDCIYCGSPCDGSEPISDEKGDLEGYAHTYCYNKDQARPSAAMIDMILEEIEHEWNAGRIYWHVVDGKMKYEGKKNIEASRSEQ